MGVLVDKYVVGVIVVMSSDLFVVKSVVDGSSIDVDVGNVVGDIDGV